MRHTHTNTSRRARSTFRPAVSLMIMIGTLGYTAEWFGMGRYHVAHKHHDIDEGLALLKEKRAHEHGGHH
jgi:hypothetical protein